MDDELDVGRKVFSGVALMDPNAGFLQVLHGLDVEIRPGQSPPPPKKGVRQCSHTGSADTHKMGPRPGGDAIRKKARRLQRHVPLE